jgi:catechol 2,3-dioxygenase-like lactoylglutathione lyase family enzyme
VTILELNHVAIHVQDVEKSCEFYSKTLRLQELHIIGQRDGPVISHNRGNHFALRVENLQPWQEHFKTLALEVRGPIQRPDGATQIFIRDVDGHVVELFTF